jgi:hypothetical protein
MHSFSVFKNEPDIRAFTAGQQICSEGDPGDALMMRCSRERWTSCETTGC